MQFGTRRGLGRPDLHMMDVIRKLNLTSGLKLCLDAGDPLSYPPDGGGQTWLDRSGNGYDFFRGTTNGSEGTDTTFQRSGGLSICSWFQTDGGDNMTYDSANETWMNNIHKDSAVFTILVWALLNATGAAGFCGTRPNTSDVGFYFGRNGNATVACQVNRGGSTAFSFSHTQGATKSWALYSFSVNEPVPYNFIGSNKDFTINEVAYSTPSASDSSFTFSLFNRGGGASSPMASGGKMAAFMAWEGVALNIGQVSQFYDLTARRFQSMS